MTFEEIFKELPADIQQEVQDFAEFLLKKRTRRKGKKLRQDWAGALSDYRVPGTAEEGAGVAR